LGAALLAEQLLDLLDVRRGDDLVLREATGPPARLVLEQVTLVRLLAHQLAAAGDPEALLRTGVRLHLRHVRPSVVCTPAGAQICPALDPVRTRASFTYVCATRRWARPRPRPTTAGPRRACRPA